MIELDNVEFYITNVCNFSCSNCNRLNNFKFTGNQIWNDYKEIYAQWSKRLSFNYITILGGEPTLNPSFRSWCTGIRELWPESEIQLVTNGSTLDTTFKDYYQFCRTHRIKLAVHCHNRERYLPLYKKITKAMHGEVQQHFCGDFEDWASAYERVKDETWPVSTNINQFYELPEYIQKECTYIHEIDPKNYLFNSNGCNLQDNNGVKIDLHYSESFKSAPLRYSGNNTFNVYDSDPVEAHNVCISRECHHFVKGKLYKCHHVVLLPEFMQQYYVEINEDDKHLLNSYIPADITFNDHDLSVFVKNLPNVIDQCKLCPSKLEHYAVDGTLPKPKVKKIPLLVIE